MPGLDGTGPRGMGPMTGGGRGFCNPGGMGGGWGRGIGGGRGMGWGRGISYAPYARPAAAPFYGGGYAPQTGAGLWASPYGPQMTKEEELNLLRDQAQMLGEQLQGIQKRVEELEKE